MATVSFVLYEVFLLNFLKGSVRPRIVNLTLSRVFFFVFFFTNTIENAFLWYVKR